MSIQEEVLLKVKHMAGKHPQKTHAGSRGSGGGSSAGGSAKMTRSELIKANGGKSTFKFKVQRSKLGAGSEFRLPDGRYVTYSSGKMGKGIARVYSGTYDNPKLEKKVVLGPKQSSFDINMDVGAADSFNEYGSPLFGGKRMHEL